MSADDEGLAIEDCIAEVAFTDKLTAQLIQTHVDSLRQTNERLTKSLDNHRVALATMESGLRLLSSYAPALVKLTLKQAHAHLLK